MRNATDQDFQTAIIFVQRNMRCPLFFPRGRAGYRFGPESGHLHRTSRCFGAFVRRHTAPADVLYWLEADIQEPAKP